MAKTDIPVHIDGGAWNTGHVQGIAVDEQNGYVYYSFTTVLVKTDLAGHVLGTVGGIVGHLGCIEFNPEDGRVYGSLEFKNDAIGQGIFQHLGLDGAPLEDAFYIAIFDGDRITARDMNAERDGIMKAVYLPDVVADYNGEGLGGARHRYGCSGVDGLSIGPVFGAAPESPRQLMIAYGVYRDEGRTDNDHQVILQYDWRELAAVARPLTQGAPHHVGLACDAKYFLYTGNTTYGVQNLCFDAASGDWCVAVYAGTKAAFPNFKFFLIDGKKAPVLRPLAGFDGEEGLCLALAPRGELHADSGVWGYRFPWGATGIHSFGDGTFYISHEGRTPPPERLHTCHIYKYRSAFDTPACFLPVEDTDRAGN